MYTASQALIDIILKNGLKDKSHIYVPEYGDKYKIETPFKPNKKRVFGIGRDKTKTEIDFDYRNISVTEGSSYITGEYHEINDIQLRSILTYFKLSYQRRNTIRKHCKDKIEDSGALMKENRELGLVEAPFDKYFEKIYNSILL